LVLKVCKEFDDVTSAVCHLSSQSAMFTHSSIAQSRKQPRHNMTVKPLATLQVFTQEAPVDQSLRRML